MEDLFGGLARWGVCRRCWVGGGYLCVGRFLAFVCKWVGRGRVGLALGLGLGGAKGGQRMRG